MGILITEQLLRAKSEHNEGVLYTLEEDEAGLLFVGENLTDVPIASVVLFR